MCLCPIAAYSESLLFLSAATRLLCSWCYGQRSWTKQTFSVLEWGPFSAAVEGFTDTASSVRAFCVMHRLKRQNSIYTCMYVSSLLFVVNNPHTQNEMNRNLERKFLLHKNSVSVETNLLQPCKTYYRTKRDVAVDKNKEVSDGVNTNTCQWVLSLT